MRMVLNISNEVKLYRFIQIVLLNGVSGNLDILDHFLERVCNMTREGYLCETSSLMSKELK